MIWMQILKLLVTWYPKGKKKYPQKLGPVFPGEGSPIPPIVHWFWKHKYLALILKVFADTKLYLWQSIVLHGNISGEMYQ